MFIILKLLFKSAFFLTKMYWYVFVFALKVIIFPFKMIYRLIKKPTQYAPLKSAPTTLFDVENKIVDGEYVKVTPQEAGYRFESFITFNILQKYFNEVYDGAKVRNSDWYPEHMRRVGYDHGIDQICVSDTEIKLVQCKYYSSPIKKEVVATANMSLKVFSDYYRSIGINKKITMEIITNSYLDGSAMAYAKSLGIYCTNGTVLNSMLEDLNPTGSNGVKGKSASFLVGKKKAS